LRPQILRVLCEGGMVSFCAWCGTAGIIAYYFRFFSPVTVIANLFIVPLASLITLTGFCSLLTAPFSPGLTSIFASSAEAMLKLLLSINALMLKLPAASFDFR
jgi:predicted membrane metal-binding protein